MSHVYVTCYNGRGGGQLLVKELGCDWFLFFFLFFFYGSNTKREYKNKDIVSLRDYIIFSFSSSHSVLQIYLLS